MSRKSKLLQQMILLTTLLAVGAATVYGLTIVNDRMTVRYQAVGRVVDRHSFAPLEGVEAILLLVPPPSDANQLNALFHAEAVKSGRLGPRGEVRGHVGPAVGLSTGQGVLLVRGSGRTGPAHAIRLGLDDSGKPPFETGWLVLKKEGYETLSLTISLLGWQEAPPDWGKHANRLPQLRMVKQ